MRASTFSGRTASQMAVELDGFIALLRQRRVRSYLEIGARHGDTFHAVMSALAPGSLGIAVDLPGGAWGTEKSRQPLLTACGDLNALGYVVRSVFGDSRDAEIVERVGDEGPFDAILIDGDHRYDGVAADWANYGRMGSLIAFHDIVGEGQTTNDSARHPVEVPRLWAELKSARVRGQLVEFVAPGSTMGIGAICR